MSVNPHYPLAVVSANSQIVSALTQALFSAPKLPLSWVPIAPFQDGKACLQHCASDTPKVAIVDLLLPAPSMTGLATIEALHMQFPIVKIIALCAHMDANLIGDALQIGALTYMLWPQDQVAAWQMLHHTYERKVFFTEKDVIQRLTYLYHVKSLTLSIVQQNILTRAASGNSVSSIATGLGIQDDTVMRHFASIILNLQR